MGRPVHAPLLWRLPVVTLCLTPRTGSSLHFEMALLDASYDGTASADGSEISGRWTQRGRSWPLVFKRAKAVR